MQSHANATNNTHAECHRDSYADSQCLSNTYRHCDSYGYSYRNGYNYRNNHRQCYPDSDVYAHTDVDSQANAYCQAECNTKAASDSGATTAMIAAVQSLVVRLGVGTQADLSRLS